MKFNDVLQAIESTEFALRTSFASGYKSFFRVVCEQESFRELVKKLLKSSRQRQLILSRINRLARQQVESEYENPSDAALAAYLHALSLVDLDLAEKAAIIITGATNLWWAEKLVRFILVPRPRNESKLFSAQYEFKAGRQSTGFGKPVRTKTTEEVHQSAPSLNPDWNTYQTVVAGVGASRSAIVRVAPVSSDYFAFITKSSSKSSSNISMTV